LLELDKIFGYNISKIYIDDIVSIDIEFYSFDSKYTDILSGVELVVKLCSDKNLVQDTILNVQNNNLTQFKNNRTTFKKSQVIETTKTFNLFDIFSSKPLLINGINVYKTSHKFDMETKEDLYIFSKLNLIQDNIRAIGNLKLKTSDSVKFEKIKENKQTVSNKYIDTQIYEDILLSMSEKLLLKPEKYDEKNRLIQEVLVDIDSDKEKQVYFVFNFDEIFSQSRFANLLEFKYFNNLLETYIKSGSYKIETNIGKSDLNVYLGNFRKCISYTVVDEREVNLSIYVKDILYDSIQEIYNKSIKYYESLEELNHLLNNKKNYNNTLDIFTSNFYKSFNSEELVSVVNGIFEFCEIFEINIDKNSLLSILNNKVFNKKLLESLISFYDKLTSKLSFSLNPSRSSNTIENSFNYKPIFRDNLFYKVSDFKTIEFSDLLQNYTEHLDKYSISESSELFYYSSEFVFSNSTFFSVFDTSNKEIDKIFINLLCSNKFDKDEFYKLMNILKLYNFDFETLSVSDSYKNPVITLNRKTDFDKTLIKKSDNSTLRDVIINIIFELFFEQLQKTAQGEDSLPLQSVDSVGTFADYVKYKKLFVIEFYEPIKNMWIPLSNKTNIFNSLLCRYVPYYNDSIGIPYNKNDINDIFNKYFIINTDSYRKPDVVKRISIKNNEIIVPSFNNKTQEIANNLKLIKRGRI